MKRRTVTRMKWNGEYGSWETNIGWIRSCSYGPENHFYSFWVLQITSSGNRGGRVSIDFCHCEFTIPPREKFEELTARMQELVSQGILASCTDLTREHSRNVLHYKATFLAYENEQFCNAAIRVALEIFKKFGVVDLESNITHFEFAQKTQVKKNGVWTDFDEYLRDQIREEFEENRLHPPTLT